MENFDYLKSLPKQIPAGKLLVHNQVKPAKRLGTGGFRAWLAETDLGIELCNCGWAAELGNHYRVK